MTRTLPALLMSLMLFPAVSAAELPKPTAVLDLWPEGPPDNNGLTGPEKGTRCVGNISKPTLLVYLPTGDRKPTSAVVITHTNWGGGPPNHTVRTCACYPSSLAPLARLITPT